MLLAAFLLGVRSIESAGLIANLGGLIVVTGGSALLRAAYEERLRKPHDIPVPIVGALLALATGTLVFIGIWDASIRHFLLIASFSLAIYAGIALALMVRNRLPITQSEPDNIPSTPVIRDILPDLADRLTKDAAALLNSPRFPKAFGLSQVVWDRLATMEIHICTTLSDFLTPLHEAEYAATGATRHEMIESGASELAQNVRDGGPVEWGYFLPHRGAFINAWGIAYGKGVLPVDFAQTEEGRFHLFSVAAHELFGHGFITTGSPVGLADRLLSAEQQDWIARFSQPGPDDPAATLAKRRRELVARRMRFTDEGFATWLAWKLSAAYEDSAQIGLGAPERNKNAPHHYYPDLFSLLDHTANSYTSFAEYVIGQMREQSLTGPATGDFDIEKALAPGFVDPAAELIDAIESLALDENLDGPAIHEAMIVIEAGEGLLNHVLVAGYPMRYLVGILLMRRLEDRLSAPLVPFALRVATNVPLDERIANHELDELLSSHELPSYWVDVRLAMLTAAPPVTYNNIGALMDWAQETWNMRLPQPGYAK